MICYINNIVTEKDIRSDISVLIPDASIRRRMSPLLRTALCTAVECTGGVEGIAKADAIITATGWGCIAESEQFLSDIISSDGQSVSPVPFMQSTFNTVGGQIAILGHNHCYNMTYANRSHSFEDALLDAIMRISDGISGNILIGAFDESTPTQRKIMERMGIYRNYGGSLGSGCVFALLGSEPGKIATAKIKDITYPDREMNENECRRKYGHGKGSTVLWNSCKNGLYPTCSARAFAEGVGLISAGAEEVTIYNGCLGMKPVIITLECI